MLDLQWIRRNPHDHDRALARRDPLLKETCSADKILPLDKEHRQLLQKQQELQSERKKISALIGRDKHNSKTLTDKHKARIESIKRLLSQQEEKINALKRQLDEILSHTPNLLAEESPPGKDDDDNVVVREEGTPPRFDFKPRDHVTLGEALNRGIDSALGVQLSGSRFTWLQGDIAHLHRALSQLMLDIHTQRHGYTEVLPPIIVNQHVLFATGQLPKFADDLYRLDNGQWLIPTAEVPLTNYARNRILSEQELPVRMTALTPCFRSEAGAAGRDTRGIIRQHQFDKVELVSLTHPEDGEQEWQRMTRCAETILKELNLAWRVVLLCSASTGFAAHKTYDIEVWLPSQNAYREISSCSLCLDFQARRMNTRFKNKKTLQNQFVWTLNGSGVAVGRALIAVMEHYQQKDGSVVIPPVLRPYMNGQTSLSAKHG